MTIKNNFNLTLVVLFLSGCAISPGMYFDGNRFVDGKATVFVESIDRSVDVISLDETNDFQQEINPEYSIGIGDQISITIWGLEEIFPANQRADQALRRVDSNGNIYFPYAGLLPAKGKTQDELRESLTAKLAESFNEPQVDVSIIHFNSQVAFVLGEVNKPQKINLSDVQKSLADIIGESLGLNNSTAKASEVFLLRQGLPNEDPTIYHLDMKNPVSFFKAGNFYIQDGDIVFVNSSGITRWNTIISQFFPFSTFIASIDSLVEE